MNDLNKENPIAESYKKILVLGLDNSGKTSIVLNLVGRINLLNYISINPTVGADIVSHKLNNSNYNIWDLGGQASFREEYLENIDEYLRGAHKIVYVIDIQDKERYDVSLEYLKNFVDYIQENQISLDFTVFLHKKDPDLKEIHPEITTEVIDHLIEQVKKVLPENFYYEIFTSSIYTVFDKTIVD